MTINLLAIDTSSEWCSAALYCAGHITQQLEYRPKQHGERLLAMMDKLLTDAHLQLSNLQAIAYARGPGSFTGVRLAAAVAQGSAFPAHLPLIGISTLAALAHAAFRQHQQQWILAALDARIGEIYWAGFEITTIGMVTALTAEQVTLPNSVMLPNSPIVPIKQWYGAGSGWAVYGNELRASTELTAAQVNGEIICTAHDIALLAIQAWQAGTIEILEYSAPQYIRNQVAIKTSERERRS
ncbi:tRNA (adenosine(37)-N6)-threonylcarbamoyltransferase complex dimerization subunit type 1 TsaB [Rhodoferax sp. 4810]|uniref:tRNA threonylcarbamoyladenosine biosynthesis protein TsaB n=1 Tax=Thiospirillum jenense TaxID=1653858 RepID=A0A839HCU4_9GAMM|nr:tRNA (adenosine(37)-N6)-threonylcarbamoyltransferase complex dimerization subunit type 1 TsaB [Thiospirillum jenense]MBB1075094.1 tRNA (adenosine(37)-N6)-threonylcarbamoyltransferase complex dimerization subunit type 1 TsaB [Rhodoferax jenense]MBB1126743.1 tRNA (adenosine(37)-N6)-threonylcarbamoyltransferase complex dimerization subunit type 1 TsaB [Thiospirillum jenense]